MQHKKCFQYKLLLFTKPGITAIIYAHKYPLNNKKKNHFDPIISEITYLYAKMALEKAMIIYHNLKETEEKIFCLFEIKG